MIGLSTSIVNVDTFMTVGAPLALKNGTFTLSNETLLVFTAKSTSVRKALKIKNFAAGVYSASNNQFDGDPTSGYTKAVYPVIKGSMPTSKQKIGVMFSSDNMTIAFNGSSSSLWSKI